MKKFLATLLALTMLIGMVGILLVIGVIVLAVMLLNRLTSRK